MEPQELDVVIIGCGPTGAVLANLLGGLGCRVAVLERDAAVHPIPRATHIDEETLRNFQATGLMEALWPHTRPFGKADVLDEDGTVLFEDEIVDEASVHGYLGSRFFDQPAFERALRAGLGRFPAVSLHLGAEVLAVRDEGAAVTVTARLADGAELALRAAFAVACDGGRSATRAALGVPMEPLAPRREWLIVDTLLEDPADAALLPDRFRYHLDRERLTLFAYGIGLNRRWEFQLREGEASPSDEVVRGWLRRFIDPARLRITRVARYAHNSLLARRFRVGRVLLAGDAAHMMPPSAGQGMCAGVRDAINLAWKLHLVTARGWSEELLDSYERERRPHVHDVLKGALFIGERLEAKGALGRWQRRQALKLISALPFVHALVRKASLRRPPLRTGFIDRESRLRGRHLPQVAVRHRGREVLLDELLGYRFALLARAESLTTTTCDWAAAEGITVLRPGVDFLEVEGRLAAWMREGALDFVLVRPDRQIFGAGAAAELPRVRGLLQAHALPAGGALAPVPAAAPPTTGAAP